MLCIYAIRNWRDHNKNYHLARLLYKYIYVYIWHTGNNAGSSIPLGAHCVSLCVWIRIVLWNHRWLDDLSEHLLEIIVNISRQGHHCHELRLESRNTSCEANSSVVRASNGYQIWYKRYEEWKTFTRAVEILVIQCSLNIIILKILTNFGKITIVEEEIFIYRTPLRISQKKNREHFLNTFLVVSLWVIREF